MARLRVNWTLLIVLVLSLVVLGLTVFGLRGWNRNYRAKIGKEKGLAAFEQKQWPEAAQFLGQYLGVHQDDTEILLKYAQAQMSIKPAKQAHLNQAVNAYRAILRQNENVEAAKNLIAIYLWIAGLPGEGQLTAERFLEKQNNPEIRQLLAACLIQQREYDKAIEQLNQVIKDDPTLVSAYDLLTQAVERKGGDAAQTELYLTQAIEKNPTSATAYIQRANYRIRMLKQQEAVEDLTQASKCQLDKTDVKILLAEAWLKSNHPEQTQMILEDVLGKEPDNASAWLLRARMVLAADKDKTEDMITVAEEGLKALGEDSTDFLPIAAELFIRANKTDRAKDCVNKLRQAQVNEDILIYIEGVIAAQEKNWSLAARSFRKVYEQGRKDENTVFYTAHALMQNGDILAASAVISGFLNTEDESEKCHLLAAQLMARQQKWDLALTHLKKALLLNPKSAKAVELILQTRLQRLSSGSASASDDSWDMLIKDMNQILQQQDLLTIREMLFQAALQSGNKELAAQQAAHVKQHFPNESKAILIEAEYLILEGKTADAEALLTRSTESKPDLAMTLMLMRIQARQKNIDKAMATLDDFIARTDQLREKLEAAMGKIDIQILTGNREQAYEALKTLAQENPDQISILRKLLDMGMATEKPETLQQWIDQIKQSEGQQGRQWRYEQARLWFERFEKEKYYVQIVDILNEVLRSYPEDRQSSLLLGATHDESGYRQLAVKSYVEAIIRSPEVEQAALAVVQSLNSRKKFSQCLDILTELSSKGYQNSALVQQKIVSLIGLEREDEARKEIESLRVLMADREKSQTELVCAQLYSFAGDQKKALEGIQAALREGMDKPDVQRNAAMSISVLLQRIDIKKDPAIAKQAEQMLNDLLTKDDQNVQAVFTLAMLYHGQDLIEQAARMYERTLALDPTQAIAANNLAWILCQHQNKPKEALELANRVLQTTPNYADLVDTRGVIYMTLGDFQKAAEDFLRSTSLYAEMTQVKPELTASTFRLGKCYVKLSKPKEARESLIKAKELHQKLGGLTPEEQAELDGILSGLPQ